MNYIKRLQEENKALKEAVVRFRSGIRELAGYLGSEKFVVDTTVQVRDVARRLYEIGAHAEIPMFEAKCSPERDLEKEIEESNRMLVGWAERSNLI